jgi:hypothetical protein
MLTGKYTLVKNKIYIEEKYMDGKDPYDLRPYYRYRKASKNEIAFLKIKGRLKKENKNDTGCE